MVHVRTAHEYARTPTVRDSANTGGQNLQILNLINVMVTSFCIDGGGGGGGGGGNSRLTRSPESDPNARGRVRGIAAGTNCDATEPSC